jgi:hypothetical protein
MKKMQLLYLMKVNFIFKTKNALIMNFKIAIPCFIILICYIPFISFSQNTTLSKRCGKCQKTVSINSKIGDYCPHCGVRWGYENTSTSTINNSNSGKSLNYYNSNTTSNNKFSQKTQTKNSVLNKPKTNPFNSYSKQQTEKWLEEKLNRYVQKRVYCPDGTLSTIMPHCITYDDYECKLDGTYLIVKYSYDNKYDKFEYLPIYDFNSASGESYESVINISNSKFIVPPFDYKSRKDLVSSVSLGFKNNSEENLVKNIQFAFAHLKTFYRYPLGSDLPEVSFKSDENKATLEDTKNWILTKLNAYIADKFEVHSSCCFYKVSSPSFSFLNLNLVMQYYDITNRIVTVTIPICDCYVGEITSNNRNDFSGSNYRFYSQKENILQEDWSGQRTIDFMNLKVSFNKEEDLFTRMQKAFKNLKSYCPSPTKQKEIF